MALKGSEANFKQGTTKKAKVLCKTLKEITAKECKSWESLFNEKTKSGLSSNEIEAPKEEKMHSGILYESQLKPEAFKNIEEAKTIQLQPQKME